MGFTTYVSYQYDSFFNPTEILTEQQGGKTVQSFSYSNDVTNKNNGYHVGRVTQEKNTQTWNGKSHQTTTKFNYKNHLLQSREIQGDGTATLTERFDYDSFGNVTKRSRSAAGLPSRTESFAYSIDGRFLESRTDISGRTASFSYHTNGTLKTETDVLGRVTTYAYDNWQRPTAVTNYLGNTQNIQYLWEGNTLITKNQNADGSQSQTWTDAWGRTIAQGQLSLNGQWSWVSYQYDAAGRLFKESLPYLAAQPSGGSQFTTTRYDSYGRMLSQKQANGKTLHFSYEKGKAKTILNDGYQKVTTTLDARGNITRLEDPNGVINYSYHPNGNLETSDYQGHQVVVNYDGWGRRKNLKDPTVGEFSYVYDIYGQLLEESSSKGTTTYTYTPDGLVKTITQKGEHTDLNTAYDYDATSRLPLTQTTTDGERQLTYSYGTTYDNYYRPINRSEQNSYARFSQTRSYDALGRIQTDKRTANLNGGASQEVVIKHEYAANGMLTALKENNKTLWELQAENARGQATEILLGNGITKKRNFDALGYLDAINDGAALSMSYSYNKKQGVLSSRKREGISESFKHDKRNRLTRIQKGTEVLEQSYDDFGRLADNPKRGEYHYDNSKRYALDSLTLNATGLEYYKVHPRQDAAYNLDRKAVSVHEHGFGRADFAYNAQMERTHAWYGGEEEALGDRSYEKHYSSLFPAEITKNNETGKTDIILYIGGDAYTAPIAKINDEVHYLHRDYLGSILAISDSSGAVVEERQFGAWGEIDFFKQNGVEKDFSASILPRGFTGHEHFSEIALIHMNGRMYDPQLRRFLSPDNNIIDPFDTRSFDRFAYGFHNPLMHIDISGENFFRAIGDWFENNKNIIITIATQIVVAVVVTILTAGIASPILAGAIVGGATGFTGGFTRTLLGGGSFGQALLAGGVEGIIGGAAGAIGGAISLGLQKANIVVTGNVVKTFGSIANVVGKTIEGAAVQTGLLAFGSQLGTQVLLQKHLDEFYTEVWERDNPGDSIEGMTIDRPNQNRGTTSSGSNEYVADNSNYGELYEETPDPFDRTEADFIDRTVSALERLASGSGGVNRATFTTGGIGNGMEAPSGEGQENEEEEEEEGNEEQENENEEEKTWYLDNDGDGYHAKGSSPKTQPESPGIGWKEGMSMGEDCDDMNAELNKLNSCKECAPERNNTDCDDCDTTKEDLKKVFPDTDDAILEKIAEHMNTHGKDFGIDTKEKLQHFLAQAAHESTNYAGKEFGAFEENLNYRWKKLGEEDYWDGYFNTVSSPTLDINKANPNDYKRNETSNFVDVEKFANYVYDDENRDEGYKLGNTNEGDGYKYRGRGIIQLTGRENYQTFTDFYKQTYDATKSFITNPDLIASDKEIAVISALWFFKNKVLDKITVDENTTVKAITKKVNGRDNGLDHREELTEKTKKEIDCD